MPRLRDVLPLCAAVLAPAACFVSIGDVDGSGGSAGSAGAGAVGGSSGSSGSAGGGATGGSAGSAGSAGSSGSGGAPDRSCPLPEMDANDAELPAPFFDLAMPEVTGKSHPVDANDDLQAVLDAVQPGDEIVIAAGTKLVGNFFLPNLGATESWVTIRSSESDALPEGQRVTVADRSKLATLSTPNDLPALEAKHGAHRFRIVGLELTVEPGVACSNLVTVGYAGTSNPADQPHHFVFDRCIFQGEPKLGSQRGLKVNAAHTAVLDSHFADFKSAVDDANAISSWNGPGPYLIHNNYLEGSMKTIRLGGENPSLQGVVASDVSICKNHITKPLTWKQDDPSWDGSSWRIGYLIAIQSARRVLVSGNVLDHSWNDDVTGSAIWIAPTNGSGSQTWATAEDVTIAFNVFEDIASGLWLDEAGSTAGIRRVRLTENLVYDLGVGEFSGVGRLLSVHAPAEDVVATDNTAFAATSFVALFEPLTTLVLRDNLFGPTLYGLTGNATTPGLPSLEAFVNSYTVTDNVLVGENSAAYPAGNFFPAGIDEVGFTDPGAGDYSLLPGSPFIDQASDGGALGADIAKIRAITAGVRP